MVNKTFEKEFEKQAYTLIRDHETIKEAFIIDELQSYMDFSDPSNTFWITTVQLRLQEKKDWEQKVKKAVDKTRDELVTDDNRHIIMTYIHNLEMNLKLEDKE